MYNVYLYYRYVDCIRCFKTHPYHDCLDLDLRKRVILMEPFVFVWRKVSWEEHILLEIFKLTSSF